MTILEKANQILADKEANLLPENLRDGITCLGVDGKLIELVGEEKSVIATTSEQEITPSEGYNGITKVIVRPVTNSIDANIVAENIKTGVTVLGVEGSYEGEILVYPSVENLPSIATEEDFAIVETPESYINSTEDTVFTKLYLPEQVVFENTQAELAGYIGLKPENGEITVEVMTGELSTTRYNFQLQINNNAEDNLAVTYLSEDGITYIRDEINAGGVFKYLDEIGVITSEIPLVPYVDSELGEDIYDGTGGHFLQEIVDPAFAGVYQFSNSGWIRIDLDTANANATASDIVSGKTAYVNGELVEGTIKEIPTEEANAAGNETMSNFAKVPLIKEVYTNSASEIYVRIDYVEDTIQRAGSMLMVDAPTLAEVIGLSAENIKAGVTILGIEGTYTGEETTGEETTGGEEVPVPDEGDL